MSAIRKQITHHPASNNYLGNVADIYQPHTIESSEFDANGIYNVYGANGIIGKYHKYNHENPQICIACRGNTCGVVNYTLPKSWITGNAMVINTDNYEVSKRYLFHYLTSVNFTSIISGSGQPQIVRKPLLNLKVYLPSMEKQRHYAHILDDLFDKIDTEIRIKSLYILQKVWLLSQMFI